MLKSAEQVSMEKKEYYIQNRDKILAKYKKRIYDLKKNNRLVPFASFATPDCDLMPEHAFRFIGKDVSEERFNYYMSTI